MAATTKTTTKTAAKTAAKTEAAAAPLKQGDKVVVQGKGGTTTATMGVSFKDAYRIDSSATPSGKALYTYWNSVLLLWGL
jgi:hypothetical protein